MNGKEALEYALKLTFTGMTVPMIRYRLLKKYEEVSLALADQDKHEPLPDSSGASQEKSSPSHPHTQSAS
jgi:hypothetical protein